MVGRLKWLMFALKQSYLLGIGLSKWMKLVNSNFILDKTGSLFRDEESTLDRHFLKECVRFGWIQDCAS